ncbi:hypothetical protein [Zhihengliuella sp.]|uniref:hypothetical protein n=1 Tax=Zhihengliuella sp. TaxID=1954483 RepID=UPI0028115007|nr:hypothetical protein [Zhihengliuella sp.]
MRHSPRRQRPLPALLLVAVLSSFLVACLGHALTADGGPRHAPQAAVGVHGPLSSAAAVVADVDAHPGCGPDCASGASAAALLCTMAAVAVAAAAALARPRRLSPGLALPAPPRAWSAVPRVPRPPSLTALGISRT